MRSDFQTHANKMRERNLKLAAEKKLSVMRANRKARWAASGKPKRKKIKLRVRSANAGGFYWDTPEASVGLFELELADIVRKIA